MLNPHPAFSPVPISSQPSTVEEQAKNEAGYRQLLVQGVLAVILPTEDLRNPCLRTLVADVMGDMILGNGVAGKACEAWMIWEGITKTLDNIKAQIEPKVAGTEIEADTRSRLEKSGLLGEIKERQETERNTRGGRLVIVSEVFWRILQYAYLTFTTTRFIILGLIAASSTPSRRRYRPRPIAKGDAKAAPMTMNKKAPAEDDRRPILSYSVLELVSQLLELPSRMPWLCGTLSLVQYHLVSGGLRVGATDGLLDK